MALSDKYDEELEKIETSAAKEKKLREAYKHAMKEGKKVGIRLMREKGLDPNKVTEQ